MSASEFKLPRVVVMADGSYELADRIDKPFFGGYPPELDTTVKIRWVNDLLPKLDFAAEDLLKYIGMGVVEVGD